MTDLSLAVIPPSADHASEGDRRLARLLADHMEGEVRFGRHDRMLYATDASIYQMEPLGVVLPKSLDDLRVVVQFAAEHHLPLLPRGGGTSLAGQTVNRALVIDTSKYLRRIIDIDPARTTCRVEPGVVLDQLNAAVASHGLRLGPDVATSAHATIGGMIGNNSSGAHSLIYGRTVEHLEGIEAILADGSSHVFAPDAGARDPRVADITRRIAEVIGPLREEIRARFPRIVRRVNGYNLDLLLDQIEHSNSAALDQVNLAHLVCGSEGTLAMTAGATLRLVPLPRRRALAIVAYAGVDEALAQLGPILQTGPAAVELLDDVVISMGRENSEYRRYVELLPRASTGRTDSVLYVEYFGDDDESTARKLHELEKIVRPNAIARYTDPSAMALAWKLRKAGEPLLHGVPGNRKPITFIEDTAVDPAKLAAFVREFRAIVTKHGTTAAYYAHASVGCLHIRPLVDPHDRRDHEKMEAIAIEVTDLVKKFGGALSGEHGDGRVRSPLLERFYGRAICDGFAAVKRLFDPENRLNPGNIVTEYSPQRMTERLRVKPQDEIIRAPAVETFFQYNHGFEDAIEQCNGAGVCRKTSGGTMCPSYRATLDERHATRGRGNALRLAITGQLTPPPFQVEDPPRRGGGRGVGHELNPRTAATDGAQHPHPGPPPQRGGGNPNWNDPETLKTLDLCLSCKACKSECPSNVDIAKLKAEYHGQRFRELGHIPLATRLIGNVRTINRIGSAIHPIANAMANFAPTRAIINRLMNMDRRRSLPRFGPSLLRWVKRRRWHGSPTRDAPVVILFPDCFTTYSEPHIGRATVEVLEAFGYRVVLPKLGCCGRSLISVGMMEKAQRVCAATAAALLAAVEEHNAVAVVGAEPSCISVIKDDWLELNATTERRVALETTQRHRGSDNQDSGLRTQDSLRNLAGKTFLIEEFLDRFWETHPRQPEFALAPGSAGGWQADQGSEGRSDANRNDPVPRMDTPGSESRATTILLHGHCHQKALWGIDTSANLLRRIFGEQNVRVLDTGCCGMAGSFGYAPHRYDLSMKIGELSLFPALRNATTEAQRHSEDEGSERVMVAAPGTSCRHQIRDGMGIETMHPIEIISTSLRPRNREGLGMGKGKAEC